MIRTKLFWKQRIVEFMTARSRYMTYVTEDLTEIEREMTQYHIDKNFYLSLQELIEEGIINIRNVYQLQGHVLDVKQKRDKIRYLLRMDENDTKAEMIKPTERELKGLKIVFDSLSERKMPNQGVYYYCTKIEDPNFWIVLIKHTPIRRAMRVLMGSLHDYESRMSKIYRATKLASQLKQDGVFVRKNIEDLDQKACGNNRIPSKCAFDIFVHLKYIKINGQQGLSKKYSLQRISKRIDNNDENS